MNLKTFWGIVREEKILTRRFQRMYGKDETHTIFPLIELIKKSGESFTSFSRNKRNKKIIEQINKIRLKKDELRDLVALYQYWVFAPDRFTDA